MQVFIPGQAYQIHFLNPLLLNQVPGHDYSTGEETAQSIPVDAVIAQVEATDGRMMRLHVFAVVQSQEDVEIRYPPPDYFGQCVLPMSNVTMAYPVNIQE